MIIANEYENGYTLHGNNTKVVVSNQKVGIKMSFYHTNEYKTKISNKGVFEFRDLSDDEIIELSNKIQNLKEFIE